MRNEDWQQFFKLAHTVLGNGSTLAWSSDTWCAWTTHASLENQLIYWQSGLPNEGDILESCTADGGLWMQSFYYSDIAHIIIPATFSWEKVENNEFKHGKKHQNISMLSDKLINHNIKHRISDKILEIKLY